MAFGSKWQKKERVVRIKKEIKLIILGNALHPVVRSLIILSPNIHSVEIFGIKGAMDRGQGILGIDLIWLSELASVAISRRLLCLGLWERLSEQTPCKP